MWLLEVLTLEMITITDFPIYVKYTKLMIDEEDVIKQPDLFGITNISLMIWTGKMVKQLILLSNGVLSKGEI